MVVAIHLLSSQLYALLVMVITCISSTVHDVVNPSMSYAEKVCVLFLASLSAFEIDLLEEGQVNSN